MKKDLDRLKKYSLNNAWWLNNYLKRIRPQVLTATIHILRERLDPEKSDRYWRLIVDPFIDHYSSILINRYFRYEHLAAETQDFVSVGLSPSSYHTFCWPYQFIEASNSSDQMNHQLLSQIARACGRCEEEAEVGREIQKGTEGGGHTGRGRATGFPTIKSWIRRFVAHTLPVDVALCNTGIANADLLGLAIRSRGRIVPVNIDRPQLEDIRVDHATRQKFRAYQTSDALTQLVVNTLGTNLPVCFLEGYRAIKKAIDSQFGDRVQPEVIVLGSTKGVPLRIWIASQAERGTVLLGLQPGGLYGEGHYTAEDRLRRLTDRFVTWGWKREEAISPCQPSTYRIALNVVEKMGVFCGSLGNRHAGPDRTTTSTEHPRRHGSPPASS